VCIPFFWGIHDGVCCADPWAFVVYAMRSGELDIIADCDERNKKGERYSTPSDVDADYFVVFFHHFVRCVYFMGTSLF
jgi:hypothetical protein